MANYNLFHNMKLSNQDLTNHSRTKNNQ